MFPPKFQNIQVSTGGFDPKREPATVTPVNYNRLIELKDPLESTCSRKFTELLMHLCLEKSILFYGIGSTRQIMQNFADMIEDTYGEAFYSLCLYGNDPNYSLLSALEALQEQVSKQTGVPAPRFKTTLRLAMGLSSLESLLTERNSRLFVFVFDMDSALMSEDLLAISVLAAIPRVHCVGSVSHTRSSFLFTNEMLANFRFSYIPCNPDGNYEEAICEVYEKTPIPDALRMCDMHSGHNADHHLHVLASLTPNHRRLFCAIGRSPGRGVTLDQLYATCKAIVRDRQRLEYFLDELLDHKLIVKRDIYGSQVFFSPIENLTDILDSLEDV